MKSFYFWSHFHTSVYLKVFTKEFNLFCSCARPSISILGPFFIEVWKYIQYRKVGSVFCGSASNCNIPMNITIGIRLKIDPSGLQQKCISGDFPQFLELSLLRTHIDGCFQSVCEAAVSRIFPKHLGKQTWRSCFKVKLWKNSKNSYFPKRALLRVSLSFGLRVSFIFLQGYRRSELLWGKSCEELK